MRPWQGSSGFGDCVDASFIGIPPFPQFFFEKKRKGWGTGVYRKSKNALNLARNFYGVYGVASLPATKTRGRAGAAMK
jgi:hypothetical protein